MFVKLIHDLVHDADVAEDFQSDPHEVFDRYGVSPEERRTIVEGGPHAVSLAAMQEFVGTLGRLQTGAHPMNWQPEMPKIRDVTPSRVHVGSGIEVKLSGDYFPQQQFITVRFERGNTTIAAQITGVSGSQSKSSEAIVRVDFPPGSAGDYTVLLGDTRVTSTVKWYPFMVE